MGPMSYLIASLTIVYSPVFSGAYQREHQSSASLAFVRGINRWPVNSPHKGPVTQKMFPFDDVIMYSPKHFETIRKAQQLVWRFENDCWIEKYSPRKRILGSSWLNLSVGRLCDTTTAAKCFITVQGSWICWQICLMTGLHIDSFIIVSIDDSHPCETNYLTSRSLSLSTVIVLDLKTITEYRMINRCWFIWKYSSEMLKQFIRSGRIDTLCTLIKKIV